MISLLGLLFIIVGLLIAAYTRQHKRGTIAEIADYTVGALVITGNCLLLFAVMNAVSSS